jgi:hypothetical protein
MNRFSQGCLAAIVLLLLYIAAQRSFLPQPVHAATPHQFKYQVWTYDADPVAYAELKVIKQPGIDFIQKILNDQMAEGWELVSAVPVTRQVGLTQILLVFRK